MFLHSQSTTVATQAYDYPEWHKGRENYALWYIEIKHPALGAYLNQLRQSFQIFYFIPTHDNFISRYIFVGF